MKAFAEDVELVWSVYNAAWSRNWGFAPVSRDEFMLMAHDMKAILEPGLVLLGEVRGMVKGAIPNAKFHIPNSVDPKRSPGPGSA